MNKGVVMEIISEKEVVVLTKDGQFLKVAPNKMNVSVGQEIIYANTTYKNQYVKARKTKNRSLRWISSIAAIFLVLFVGLPGFVGNIVAPQAVDAYVSVDINPSVELGINKNEHVVEASALNDDGEKILNVIYKELLNKDIDDALQLIIDESKQEGYLVKDSEIIITTTKLKENNESIKLEERITKAVSQVSQKLKEESSVNITSFETSSKFREEAINNGVSAGKYALYVLAKKQDSGITIEDIKGKPVNNWKNTVKAVANNQKGKKITAQEIDQMLEGIQIQLGLPKEMEEKIQKKMNEWEKEQLKSEKKNWIENKKVITNEIEAIKKKYKNKSFKDEDKKEIENKLNNWFGNKNGNQKNKDDKDKGNGLSEKQIKENNRSQNNNDGNKNGGKSGELNDSNDEKDRGNQKDKQNDKNNKN